MPDSRSQPTYAGPGKLKCSQQLQPHFNKRPNKLHAPLLMAAIPAPKAPAPLQRHTSLPTKLSAPGSSQLQNGKFMFKRMEKAIDVSDQNRCIRSSIFEQHSTDPQVYYVDEGSIGLAKSRFQMGQVLIKSNSTGSAANNLRSVVGNGTGSDQGNIKTQFSFKRLVSADWNISKDRAKKYSFKSLSTEINGVTTTNASIDCISEEKDSAAAHVASVVPALVVPHKVVTRASAAASRYTMPTASVTAMTGLGVSIIADNYSDIIHNHDNCLRMLGSVMIDNNPAGANATLNTAILSPNDCTSIEPESTRNDAVVKGRKTSRQRVERKVGATENTDDMTSVSTNAVTTKTVRSSPKQSAPDVKTDVPVDSRLVYFDLETTGLSYKHEIVQISCVCTSEVGEGAELDIYTLPLRGFDPVASAITGLTKQGSTLLLRGSAVPTVPLKVGLMRLVTWLEGLSRPSVLVGHNSKSFDSPRLILALWNNNLLHRLQASICGFSDTLPLLKCLLPARQNHKLDSLLAEYCSNSNEVMAHNALHDCRALEQVLRSAVALQPETCHPERSANSVDRTVRNTPEAAGTCNDALTELHTISNGAVGGGKWVSSPISSAAVGGMEAAVSSHGPGAACLSADEHLRRRVTKYVVQGHFTIDAVLESLRKSAAAARLLKSTGS